MPDDLAPAQRLEDLESVLEELREANLEKPVLVEGAKDVTALRELGLQGDILVVNTGATLVNLVEDLDRQGVRELVLLLDWDRTGGRLQRRLRELLDTHVIRWSDRERQALVRIVGNEARSVESLVRFRQTLRMRAGR